MYFKKISVDSIKNFNEKIDKKIEERKEGIFKELIFYGKNLPSQLKKNIRFTEVLFDILNQKVAFYTNIKEVESKAIRIECDVFNDISEKYNNLVDKIFEKKLNLEKGKDFLSVYYSDSMSFPIWNFISNFNRNYFKMAYTITNNLEFTERDLINNNLLIFTDKVEANKIENSFIEMLKHMMFFSIKKINEGNLLRIKIEKPHESNNEYTKYIYIGSDSIKIDEKIEKNIYIEKMLNDINVLYQKIQEMSTIYALKNSMHTKNFVRKLIALTEMI